MRAFTDSFIVLNPGQNYTVNEPHHCITYSVKNTHFFTGKVIVTASKRYFSIVVPQVDGGRGVSEFYGERSTHIKKTKCFKIVQTNGLSVHERKYSCFKMRCSE